jgi:hypothetical protein
MPNENVVVKVQSPSKHPDGRWLVYQEGSKAGKLYLKSALPQIVQDTVDRMGGWAYFNATFDGKTYELGSRVTGLTW